MVTSKKLDRFSGVALGIGAILCVAAYGKWLSPAPLLQGWDRGVGVFEVLGAVALVWGCRAWKTWLAAGGVFAVWGGYAAYWFFLKLPCRCMGESLPIPAIFSLLLDILFFGISLFFAYRLKKDKRVVYWMCALGMIGVGIGVGVARGLYALVSA